MKNRRCDTILDAADNTLPKIDPSQIPDCDYDLACTVLFSCINRALADPKRRLEYEKWLEERDRQRSK